MVVSGFKIFASQVRPQLRAQFPNHSFKELTLEIAREWNELKQDDKDFYNAKAEKQNQESDKKLHKSLNKYLHNIAETKKHKRVKTKKIYESSDEEEDAHLHCDSQPVPKPPKSQEISYPPKLQRTISSSV
ncbi:MAG: high mobility group box domain-containing protein [Methanobrevibacter sp.]|jgi:hypothetical protein|nr:high mobility group box domain-containing protein [Candidatus Methanovirga australis]